MTRKAKPDEGVVFGSLSRNGVMKTRVIPQSALLKCPHAILMPDHYRADTSCRCNDRAHIEMKGWGYRWDEKLNRWK